MRRKPSAVKAPPPTPEQRPKSYLQYQLKRLYLFLQQRKSPARVIEEYLNVIAAAGPSERAGILATALLAKKMLDSTRVVDHPFPEKYFEGAPVDDAARAELITYAKALMKFGQDMDGAALPIAAAVSRGVPLWIASCYILVEPSYIPQGKQIWAKLNEAEDGVIEAHKFLVRRDPSEIEKQYFTYRPKVFV